MPYAATRRTPHHTQCTAVHALCCYPHPSHARRGMPYTATRPRPPHCMLYAPPVTRYPRTSHAWWGVPYNCYPPSHCMPHTPLLARHLPRCTLYVCAPPPHTCCKERNMRRLQSVPGCGARREWRGVRCVALRTPYIFAHRRARRMRYVALRTPYIFAPHRRARRTCATHTQHTCVMHARRIAVRALRTRCTTARCTTPCTARRALCCFLPHAPPLAAQPVMRGGAYACAPPLRMSQHACTAHGGACAALLHAARPAASRTTPRHTPHHAPYACACTAHAAAHVAAWRFVRCADFHLHPAASRTTRRHTPHHPPRAVCACTAHAAVHVAARWCVRCAVTRRTPWTAARCAAHLTAGARCADFHLRPTRHAGARRTTRRTLYACAQPPRISQHAGARRCAVTCCSPRYQLSIARSPHAIRARPAAAHVAHGTWRAPCITGQDLLSALHRHVVVCPSSGAAVICQILACQPPFDAGSITVTTAQNRHFAGPTVQVLGSLPLPSVCFIQAVQETSTDPPYYAAWLPAGHALCHFFLQFKAKVEMSSLTSAGQTPDLNLFYSSLLSLSMSGSDVGTPLAAQASDVHPSNLLGLDFHPLLMPVDTPTMNSRAQSHSDPPFLSISAPDVETQPALEASDHYSSNLLTPTTDSDLEYSLPQIIDLDALWNCSVPPTPCPTGSPTPLTHPSPLSTPYHLHTASDIPRPHLPPVGPSEESIAAVCASLVPDYVRVASIARFAAGKKSSGLVALAQSFFAMEHILASLGLEPKTLEASKEFRLTEEMSSTWNGSQVILQFGWSSTTFNNKYRLYNHARKIAAGTWKDNITNDGANKSLHNIFCGLQYLWSPDGPLHPTHRFAPWKPPHNASSIQKSAASLCEKILRVNMTAISSKIDM
ncbi:hypothetical protein GGX14DRAFT_580978 [Mycena pura]|uniref:Uncharacterized protein n=1 Tax=Mycena pura TaxID=153505 RepID=A0AAD6Y0N5_9AGAR|nr:hypothetical protein GGX14DRAFT_580978 [Mycena pura]